MTERQTAPPSPMDPQPVPSPSPVGYVYANGAPQGDRPTEGLNREFVDALITVCSDHRAKGTLVVGVHADLLETLARFAERLLLLEALARLPRKTRTLTKAEAEALLTEKLGESVRIK